MAILAKTLMDIYYAEERSWLDKMDEASEGEELKCMDIARAYSDAESMVNNLMHGRRDSDWIPQFARIMRERAEESEPYLAEHFELAAKLAEDALNG